MPKMVWIKGKNGQMTEVRAGSWSTKPDHEKWRILDRELDHARFIPPRVVSMLDWLNEFDAELAYWRLEELGDEVAQALAAFPRQRRVALLRAKADSTTFPEEAASLRAKADELEAG